jgi:hypothetical protein
VFQDNSGGRGQRVTACSAILHTPSIGGKYDEQFQWRERSEWSKWGKRCEWRQRGEWR